MGRNSQSAHSIKTAASFNGFALLFVDGLSVSTHQELEALSPKTRMSLSCSNSDPNLQSSVHHHQDQSSCTQNIGPSTVSLFVTVPQNSVSSSGAIRFPRVSWHGNYVALSSFYASAEGWAGVEMIREEMKMGRTVAEHESGSVQLQPFQQQCHIHLFLVEIRIA